MVAAHPARCYARCVRTILHADLDAFYASVEVLDDPNLRGRPLLVGGDMRRGVVCAASYEARARGAKSAMPMARAMRLVPDAVVRPPRFSRYQALSDQFFGVLRRYSPLVESLSLDEAFFDVTGEERLFGTGVEIATRVRRETRDELGLAVSVGVAPNKFVAKIASDLCKPDGLLEVPQERVLPFLHALPVERLWGVGPATADALRAFGVSKIGELAAYPPDVLQRKLGDVGLHLAALARGQDDRPVVPDREPVSLGHEDTFSEDISDAESLRLHLLAQADAVAARLRARALRARTVVLKVKLSDFTLLTRRRTLSSASCDGTTLAEVAHTLLTELRLSGRAVRLTGVTASGLVPHDTTEQLDFDAPTRKRREALGHTLDAITHRFGRSVIQRAAHAQGRDTVRGVVHHDEDGGEGPRRVSPTDRGAPTTRRPK